MNKIENEYNIENEKWFQKQITEYTNNHRVNEWSAAHSTYLSNGKNKKF